MSAWGKIVGSTAGLAMGGPLGALLGLALGGAVDAGVDHFRADSDATRKVAFTIGVIALAAKMARADGEVTQDEIRAFRRVFQVPPADVPHMERVFNLARQHTAGFDAYARQIARLMADRPAVLEDLLDVLFHIAAADGRISPEEEDYLATVAEIFGVSDACFARVASRHQPGVSPSPYAVLGLSPDVDMATVRKRYRSLVRDNHPDKLMAAGVPSDFIRVATDRVAEINAAYDRIVGDRAPKPA
ncbi:TerB family tellurite resistance protein [Yunchengibacter salinarum]|uniref:TerB family tellurite resistance protein n=1 Tax=Yunchengibacter salinarum TaxID=3133399 RepID=UPI0035B5C60F